MEYNNNYPDYNNSGYGNDYQKCNTIGGWKIDSSEYVFSSGSASFSISPHISESRKVEETIPQSLIPERVFFGEKIRTEMDANGVSVKVTRKTTTVLWKDGSRTTVICSDNDVFSEENGVAMCIVRKMFTTRSDFLRLVKNAYRKPEKKVKKEDTGTVLNDTPL